MNGMEYVNLGKTGPKVSLPVSSLDRDAKDAAILEKNAKRLNLEAVDLLEYQNLPD